MIYNVEVVKVMHQGLSVFDLPLCLSPPSDVSCDSDLLVFRTWFRPQLSALCLWPSELSALRYLNLFLSLVSEAEQHFWSKPFSSQAPAPTLPSVLVYIKITFTVLLVSSVFLGHQNRVLIFIQVNSHFSCFFNMEHFT